MGNSVSQALGNSAVYSVASLWTVDGDDEDAIALLCKYCVWGFSHGLEGTGISRSG
jgi:hypothetical protein